MHVNLFPQYGVGVAFVFLFGLDLFFNSRHLFVHLSEFTDVGVFVALSGKMSNALAAFALLVGFEQLVGAKSFCFLFFVVFALVLRKLAPQCSLHGLPTTEIDFSAPL